MDAPITLLYLSLVASSAKSLTDEFTFNGFQKVTNLSLDGSALITPEGVLQLTNITRRVMGHAFFSSHVLMLKNLSDTSRALSFSTEFLFEIVSEGNTGGQGFVFAVSPSKVLPGASVGAFLGLLGNKNDGNISNHVFGVEFDTVATGHKDIDDNHVGIDINSIVSNTSRSAGYYTNDSTEVRFDLENGGPIQAWIDYNGTTTVLNVTIAPTSVPKPRRPLISIAIDLSPVFKEYMYVGFSSSTGKSASSHYISGWSFKTNGIAQPLDLSKLPKFPQAPKPTTPKSIALKFGVISSLGTLVLIAMVIFASWYIWQKAKLADTIEDWEVDYPHRFAYRDLYKATKGFKETELLGVGGFGHVYKGVLRRTGQVVAIKKISNGSNQGMKEFVTEVASLGKVRHRHLVELQGWCKRNHDLLLVYEFMPNGSLDKLLFDSNTNPPLPWEQRFKILKAIASGVLYLHEEWEQVIVHRDIKAANILLDADMNAKLSDFGLARLYDRGSNPLTTRVVGTLGYMAPELSQTGKATTSTDVFAFGAVLLEVTCGRRPIEPSRESNLVDWVKVSRMKGELLRVVDPRLGMYYAEEEVEMVLKLGLVCCQSIPEARPGMRQVMQYLNGEDFLAEYENLVFKEVDIEDFFASRNISYPSSRGTMTSSSLKDGR